MQALFIATSFLGGLYFLASYRRFDYFSLAFFSAVVYFLPGFFGFTALNNGAVWVEAEMHTETYQVMIAVLYSILLSSWLCRLPWANFNLDGLSKYEAGVTIPLLLMTLIGFTGLVLTSGSTLFDPMKSEILEGLGRWHILFYTAASVGFPLAFFRGQFLLAWIFFLFLCFDLFVGFRSSFAISLIAVVTVYLHSKGPQRLVLRNWRIILAAILFGIFMFAYKYVAFLFKAGLWDVIWAQLVDPETYLLMVIKSEPFVIQSTLNEVIRSQFYTTADHIYSSIYQLLLFSPELGAENISFNQLFQSALFPEIEFGLAANIWAQMWSAGGWVLLWGFLIFFNLTLAIGNLALNSKSILIKVGMAPMFCYWAFYLHRNDLGFAINLEKRVFLVLLFSGLAAFIVRWATRHSRTAHV